MSKFSLYCARDNNIGERIKINGWRPDFEDYSVPGLWYGFHEDDRFDTSDEFEWWFSEFKDFVKDTDGRLRYAHWHSEFWQLPLFDLETLLEMKLRGYVNGGIGWQYDIGGQRFYFIIW